MTAFQVNSKIFDNRTQVIDHVFLNLYCHTIFEFTSNAVIFFLKKMKCVIFIEKREKQNKSRKNKLKI